MQESRMVFENVARFPHQSRMPLEDLEKLLHALGLAKNINVVQKNRAVLAEVPLVEWMSELEKLEGTQKLDDVDDLIHYMERFKAFYKEALMQVKDFR